LSKSRIARLAKEDLRQIARYTFNTWGESQMRKYDQSLREGFALLADHNQLGRPCDSLQHGLRRFEIEKHVVFYLYDAEGILVVRVLHESIVPLSRYFD